jgi:hypothetical protein
MAVLTGNQRLSERWRNALKPIAGLLLSGVLLLVAGWESDRQERVQMDAFRTRIAYLADREILVVRIDRNGYLAYTDSTIAKPGLYLSDRTYFRHFVNGGKDRFYVEEPVWGRIT